MNWVLEEMEQIELGDKRLEARAVNLLNNLGSKPLESIPIACRGWAETKAAYRFFDNDKVTADKILTPHRRATFERMKAYSTILLIQDTTHLNYSTQYQREDIGPLIHNNYRGILLHPTIAVTPKGLCLGVIDDYHWHRKHLKEKTRHEKNVENLRTPIEDKESYRWVKGYQKADAIARQFLHHQIVSIADREADIYDIYNEASLSHSHAKWLIRAIKNRPLIGESGKRDACKLWDTIRDQPITDYRTFDLPARGSKPARKVIQSIQAQTVCLHPPIGRRGKLRMKPISVNGIIAREVNPPVGEKPIEWLLLTNLEIDTSEKRQAILQYYICRWQIEVFFRVLKSGCRVEKLQLNCEKRYGPCLAFYLIIAWRILYLTLLSRFDPDKNCDLFFSALEWQTIYRISKQEKPPDKAPPLSTILSMVASLGGFLNRKGDKVPGPTAVWIGLQRLKDFTLAAQVFNKTYG